MEIVTVIYSLQCGGAERAMIALAGGLSRLGHKVTLITLDGGEDDFYPTPPGAHRLALDVEGKYRGLEKNYRRIASLRRAILPLDPKIVISSLDRTNLLVSLALWDRPCPLVVVEQNHPQYCPLPPFWQALRRILYRRADSLVSVSRGVDRAFRWVGRNRRHVIYNPLSLPEEDHPIPRDFPGDREKKWLIAMGRLHRQKGFDQLIPAFSQVSPDHPDWQLIIVGEGPEREALEELVSRCGGRDSILIPGRVDHPFPIFRQGDLFVMSSRYEGCPNVLLEALASGLPVVSTDCPSGPREIIRSEVDGVLVPVEDQKEMVRALDRLMGDEEKRREMGIRAREVEERFGWDQVERDWVALIERLVGD